MKLITSDCLLALKEMPDNSVDSVVTDPPYGLSFMGKAWDYDVPSVEIWKEALRVLKPGGYLLSFAGSRTYHRMAVNIEDAGFEIRDMIEWVYGSGFPKSLNIGKAYDKKMGNERTPYERPDFVARSNKTEQRKSQVICGEKGKYTKGTSEWEGWGTALKPAHEPIVMARKPLIGTVVENVMEYDTGGINIDGCRVEGIPPSVPQPQLGVKKAEIYNFATGEGRNGEMSNSTQGRFPANLIHDGSDEVVGLFPSVKGQYGGKGRAANSKSGRYAWNNGKEEVNNKGATQGISDSGSAARFFYCAKASKSERNAGLEGLEAKFAPKGNNEGRDMSNPKNHLGGMQSSKMQNFHPTVKPIALMQYLVRLVTPPNGTVLDPFMGSGTTGIASKKENFDFIGIEMSEEYVEIARARIEAV